MAELDPLPDDLRALLEAERRREEPADATRDRVLLRLGATVGWGAPLAHAAGAAPQATKRALGRIAHLGRAANLARASAIFVAGAASGAGGYRAVEHARSQTARPAPQVARAPQADLPAPPAPLPDVVPAAPMTPPPPSARETPAPRPRRTAVATPPARPAVRADDHLAAERALLEIAREALVRGQADGALAALACHEATFPQGELAEERDGLFVQALVAAHRDDEARLRAARFDHRYPRSLFAPVVRQALRSIP